MRPSPAAGCGARRRCLALPQSLCWGLLVALWWPTSESPPAVAEADSAVAILPFENRTGQAELDYLGPGLAAGLVSELSSLRGVNIVGRSRAWSAHQAGKSPQALAETLGANVLIRGKVGLAGDDLRVEVSLLEGSSGASLWSGNFQQRRHRVYELQQEIVRACSRLLSLSLTPDDRRRLARGGPVAQAFDVYLQGLERLEDSGNPRHAEFAADLFRQAIAIQEDVAVFHAGLSNALSQQRVEGFTVDAAATEKAARRALELDPGLADAYYALARALRGSGRYAESVAALRPVLAQHPKPDEAFRELGHSYVLAGDVEAARKCFEEAVRLGPNNWYNWNAQAVFQAEHGEAKAAIDSLGKALEVAPSSAHWPLVNLGGVKLMVGDYAGAVADFEASGSTTTSFRLASNMASAYFFQGRLDRAAELYRRAAALEPGDHVVRRNLGDVLLALGDDEGAESEFRTALGIVERELALKPNDNDRLAARALYTAKTGGCELAVDQAATTQPLLSAGWQNHLHLAMAFALCDRTEQALDEVGRCLDDGLTGLVLRQQPELRGLAQDPRFIQLTGR